MKKILIILFCMMFLINCISAFEFDNVKHYDELTKTATINDCNLWLGTCLNEGEKIADIKLISPQINYVMRGEDRLVAEFEITNYGDYENTFNNMEFYNLKKAGIKTEREFIYKYRIEEDPIQVPIYENVCNKVTDLNETYEVCEDKLTGYSEQKVYDWKVLNDKNTLPEGTWRVGIFTDVKPNENIEWIPTLFGVEIKEWAAWSETFNQNLIAYWDMEPVDTGASQNYTKDIYGGLYNGTTNINVTSGFPKNVTGKFGNAFSFTKTAGKGEINFTGMDMTAIRSLNRNFSISAWVYANGITSTYDTIFTNGYSGWSLGSTNANNFDIYETGIAVEGINAPYGQNQWVHVVMNVHANNSVEIFVNGTRGATGTTSRTFSDATATTMIGRDTTSNGGGYIIDEIALWNRTLTATEVSELYNSGAGTFYGASGIVISLNNPPNAYNSTNKTVDINCSASSSNIIDNVSLYINGALNYTQTDGVTNFTELYQSFTLQDGSYNWTCNSYDENNNLAWAEQNYTLTIDSTKPVLNITYPLNTTYTTNYTESSSLSIALNWTTSDTNLESCWFYNLSSEKNESVTCGQNVTMVLPFGPKYFIVYANDTSGNIGSDNVSATFDFGLLRNNLTYSNQTLEGALETFEFDFNISQFTSETVDLVQLTYNGTVYNATLMSSVGDNYIADVEITIPPVSANLNLSFAFNVTMSDGTIYDTTYYNQSVLNLVADNCSSYNTTLFSFYLLEEETQVNLTTLVGTTIELSLKLLSESRVNYILNFSNSYVNINPANVCLNLDIPIGVTIPADVIVKYYADGYATEYYNIYNYSLTNSTINQTINLYDLNSSDSTEFKITLTGNNYVPIEGALISIQRQYLAENGSFKTVEIPITDTNGQTIGHFVKNDVVYNLIAIKNGEIVSSLLNVIAFCEDLQLGNCVISMDPDSAGGSIFNYNNQGITFSAPTFNSNTSAVSFYYSSTDGSTKNVLMSVNKNDIFGNRSICNDTLSSAAGSLSCSIPGDFADTSIVVEIYTEGELTAVRTINVDSNSYGDVGYIIWFVLTLVLIFIFGESKTGILISMVVSYVGAVSLTITKGNLIGLGTAGIWLIVITIVGVWKLNSRRQQ